MNAPRAFAVALISALAPGCAGGCDGGSRPRAGAEAGGGADVRPMPRIEVAAPEGGAQRTFRPTRHGGFAGLVLRAGREAELTAEQKASVFETQEKLQQAEPPLNAVDDFRTDLVAGVRAGKLDTAKLEADYAAIDENLRARQEKQADALDALHKALDATARSALVEAAKTRLEAMFRTRHELLEAGAVPDAGEPPWIKHRQNRMRSELALDDAQLAKVTPLLAKVAVSPAANEVLKEVVRTHAEAMLAAFEKDELDAHKLDFSPTGGKASPHAALEREAKLIALVLPILTPEQLERLANARQRRLLGRWAAEPDPWSPFDESMEHPGGPR